MSESVKTFIRLGILCVIAFLCLFVTNLLTGSASSGNSYDTVNNVAVEFFPTLDASKTETADIATSDTVLAAYIIKDSSDSVLGYLVSVQSQGFGGPILFDVGLADDGTVQGLHITEHTETAGLGAKIEEADFYGQFNGVASSFAYGDEVQAISGATITSDAVKDGINAAAEAIAS